MQFCVPVLVWGQAAISTRIGRDSLLVGDSLHVVLEVRAPRGADVRYTIIPDTLAGGLELFCPPVFDTLIYSDSVYRSRYTVPVVAYDSGWFYIPRIPVLVQYSGVSDTLYSEGRPLYVGLVARDSAVKDIMPIMGPLRQRITFGELLPWLLGVLLLAGLAFGIYYLWHRRRGKAQPEVAVADSRPADVVALERLRHLRDEKAWRNPGTKYYYTELTETLRVFIGRVWGVRSMEETTGKIVAQLREVPACDTAKLREVESLLQLGDLAKFARFAPEEEESISASERAIELVETVAREEADRVKEGSAAASESKEQEG